MEQTEQNAPAPMREAIPTTDAEQEIHLWDYYSIVRSRLWTVVTFFFVVVLATLVATLHARPVYEATVRILLGAQGVAQDAPGTKVQYVDWAQDERYLATQYKILEGRALAKLVTEKLALKDSPEFAKEKPNPVSRAKSWVIGQIKTAVRELVPTTRPEPKAATGEDAEISKLVSSFSDRVEVKPVPRSRLVDVTFSGYHPKIVAQIANAMAGAYQEEDTKRKLEATQSVLAWLQREQMKYKKDLEQSESVVQAYKEKHAVVSLEDSKNVVVEKLLGLNRALVETQAKLIRAETVYNKLQEHVEANKDLWGFPDVAQSPLVAELKARYVELLRSHSELSKKFGPKHPKMIELMSQLDVLKDQIDGEVKRLVDSIETSYRMAKAEEEQVLQALEAQKAVALDLDKKAIAFNVLKRDAETNRQLFEVLLTRAKETAMTGEVERSNIHVIAPAEVPLRPSKPRLGLNIVLAALVGVFGGIGLAFFLDYLDNSIKGPEDVEAFLNLPVLGTVGRMKGGKKRQVAFVDKDHKDAAADEAFRTLRTNVTFCVPESQRKILVVTSAIPGEGKTTIACNLAAAFAQLGRRVLLVDGDMRKPMVHRTFGLDGSGHTGLSALLVEECELEDAIKETDVPNLYVIPCGNIPPNQSELLASSRMAALVKEWREQFDVILLDSPPVTSVTDPIILAGVADGAILVVRGGETGKTIVKSVVKQLEGLGVRPLGAVLNGADMRKGRYYYHHYRYYHYYRSYYK